MIGIKTICTCSLVGLFKVLSESLRRSGCDFQRSPIQKVTAMAQRAIREVDGKRLLAQWMKDAWDIGFGVEALDGMTARQAFTVEGPTVNWTALADAYAVSPCLLPLLTLFRLCNLCMQAPLGE